MSSNDPFSPTGRVTTIAVAFALILLAGCGPAIEQAPRAATPAPPAEAVEPTEPEPPTDPTEPVDPADPAPPVDPAHPVEPPEPPEPPPADEMAQPVVTLSTRLGPPGTELELSARSFTPNATVRIGFGPPGTEHRVIEELTADAAGVVNGTVRVPDWAAGGTTYVFIASGPTDSPLARSDHFHVPIRDGTVRVVGRLTDEGVECQALRTDDDVLYTLTGNLGDVRPGDRVIVEGTLPEASICMQGTTIAVERIERAAR